MKRKWLNTDPDSFRGKLYLLLIDKIVLGLAIGIAFVAYDRWKLRDQRAYDDRTILAFQRASYVKELVPMVVDSKLGLPARAQALIALIETQSIGDKNALGLTELLLRQGLIRADYPEHLMWNRDHPLLDALETMMPPALEPLLEHYVVSAAPDETHQLSVEVRSDIEEFWSELFVRTLDQHTDSEIVVLNSDKFLSEYLWAMDRLIRPLEKDRAKAWFARNNKGLRILAALSSVDEVGTDQHTVGRKYLLTLISLTHLTSDNLSLAGTVIHLQQEKQWASKALAARCVEVVVQQDEDMKIAPDYYRRSLDASGYIEWYATTKRDEAETPFAEGDGGNGWEEIQPMLGAGLKTYLLRISGEKIQASDFGPAIRRNSIALPLIKILLDGIERGDKPSEATCQLLAQVNFLSDDRLHALLLDRIDFRSRWARDSAGCPGARRCVKNQRAAQAP